MVTRLVGGLTPGDGSDPRTFPAIWNDTAGTIESQGSAVLSQGSAISAIEADLLPTAVGSAVAGDSLVYDGADWVNGPRSGNAIINGDFGVWQRGTSFTNPSSDTYTADRFRVNYIGNLTATRQSFSPGELSVPGYGDAEFYARFAWSGVSTVRRVFHFVENVRTFSGQKVTVSFWYKSADSGSLGVLLSQLFGSGGSATVNNALTSPALSNTWQRYSATITLPSVAGKTIGANNSLLLQINSPVASDVTLDIWGVQVEAGPVATPFKLAGGGRQGAELALCQRYYQRPVTGTTQSVHGFGSANSTTSIFCAVKLSVSMRIKPVSVETSNLAASDLTARLTPSAITLNGDSTTEIAFLNLTVTGATQFRPYFLVNDNNVNGFVGLSAEL